jgi:glycosyltransferase involved in cell wall biosynthesis
VHRLDLPEATEKSSVKKMSGIITVCEEQNYRLNQLYNYPFEKMEIVHNTPQLSCFKNIPIRNIEKPIVFGHHGHMSAEKSIEPLIRGFLKAAEKNKEIKLILAGAGESYGDMADIANESPYKDRIHFLGRYDNNDLANILAGIDVGVIPYQVSDFNNFTIHNKLFDYFAAGKPVIVSQAKPLKRVVEETNSGISVDCTLPETLAESIIQFSNISENEYKSFANNALKAANEKYNWEFDSKNLYGFIAKFL